MSLVPILVLGAVLAHTLRQQAVDRNIQNGREAAHFFGQFGVVPQLSRSDMTEGLDRRGLDRLDEVVSASRSGTQVVRVKVWNRAGRVVYSDDRRIVGRRFPPTPAPFGARLPKTSISLFTTLSPGCPIAHSSTTPFRGRLRHRLLVADLPAGAPRPGAQDRQELREGDVHGRGPRKGAGMPAASPE